MFGTKTNTDISMLDSRRASCQIFDCLFFFLFFLDCFLLSKSKLHIPLLLCFHMLEAKSRWEKQKQKGWVLHSLSTGMAQIIVQLKAAQCFRNISLFDVATSTCYH